MRWKSLAVKSLVYLTFLLSLSGVIFCVVYKARHPTSNYIEAKRQTENKPAQGGDKVAAIQQASTKPDYQTTQNEQSYDSKWSDPIVILTVMLVAGVFITNCIYYGQLKKMRETVALLAGQGSTMRGQLAAMEWQAGIFETQAGLFDKQVKVMQGQLSEIKKQGERHQESVARERAMNDPRLRVADVRVVHLAVDQEPTFIVTIVNDGMVDAPEVRFRMHVKFGDSKTLTLDDDNPFPIPARGRESYSITDVSRLTQQDIDGFNSSVPLVIEGHVDFWITGPQGFCFKFQPWPQGENRRPEGVRQFIPCSRRTTVDIGIALTGVESQAAVGTLTVSHAPKDEPERERKDEGENPNQ
jgi:hypothetical protein